MLENVFVDHASWSFHAGIKAKGDIPNTKNILISMCIFQRINLLLKLLSRYYHVIKKKKIVVHLKQMLYKSFLMNSLRLQIVKNRNRRLLRPVLNLVTFSLLFIPTPPFLLCFGSGERHFVALSHYYCSHLLA